MNISIKLYFVYDKCLIFTAVTIVRHDSYSGGHNYYRHLK